MPTREAYGVAALALLIFFVAFNLQAGWVYAVDALLIGLLIAGFLSTRLSVRGISIRRAMPAEAVEGEPVRVTLTLTAQGVGRRFFVEALDAVPGLEPAAVLVPLLVRNQAALVSYVSTAVRRGRHRVEQAAVRSGGLTGFFVARRWRPAPGEITIFPRYWKLSKFSLGGWSPAVETAGSARRRGGLEFHSLRDYRSGDSMRHVHWRSSARRSSLMVREFEREIPGSVGLLLDTRPQVQAGDGSNGTFEDLVRVAASIAWYVTTHGGSVRLVAGRGSTPLEVGGGWREVMQALADIQPDGTLSPDVLLSRIGPGREGDVIVITPDAGAVNLAMSRTQTSVILADVASYGGPEAPAHRPAAHPQDALCVLRRGDDIRARLENSS